MKREIIYVDENGVTPDGDSFELSATPEAIKSGVMINLPVTLVFPDGRRLDTNQAKVAPIGMTMFEKALGNGG